MRVVFMKHAHWRNPLDDSVQLREYTTRLGAANAMIHSAKALMAAAEREYAKAVAEPEPNVWHSLPNGVTVPVSVTDADLADTPIDVSRLSRRTITMLDEIGAGTWSLLIRQARSGYLDTAASSVMTELRELAADLELWLAFRTLEDVPRGSCHERYMPQSRTAPR